MKKGDKFEIDFIITNQVYDLFVSTFNDKNPLHISDEFAKQNGFKSKVMHGNILNGFVSYFVGECLPIKNVIIQTQEIKYFKPSYLNDNLKYEAEICDVFDSVNSIEIKFVFKNVEKQKVASGKINIGILK
jgi:3-hydroxybutyryl-CoA dehydratase